MSLVDKKVIGVFRTFIEKVFVPQLPKMDMNCRLEWNKFASLLASEQVILNEMQLYVDSLSLNGSSTPSMHSFNSFNNIANKHSVDRNQNKSPFMPKRKEGEPGGFNVLKTFGGERNRIIFDPKDYEEAPQIGDRLASNLSKDFSKDKDESGFGLTTQMVLPTLEKLFKVFNDNHVKIERTGSFAPYQARVYT